MKAADESCASGGDPDVSVKEGPSSEVSKGPSESSSSNPRQPAPIFIRSIKQKNKIFVAKRLPVKEKSTKKQDTNSSTDLQRQAVEEILRETKRTASRASAEGGSWLRAPKVQKRLVNNTLLQVVQNNRRENASKNKESQGKSYPIPSKGPSS